ncbi:MAG: thioredoxin domain-containing protein [Acidobacteria bacterium]|nr:thioredoxin domain-containing protein [Acidobacteriota bacterium]MYJ04438.1 thioredoxin domain-containing protein [Acidobacteriota bacterium]
MPNRLAAEPSPYLQQHAENPVDWYPWGDEAFARARTESKPIFLSIGYSTCHWCHVMEHESFEHAGIAALLNEHFVPVKVDREERPDVDRVYMAFVQATTGSGGWPMSVWLTPDLKPFFGGTYFPPDSRWGRVGFADVLREVASRWSSNRAELEQSADTILDRLRAIQSPTAAAPSAGTTGGIIIPGGAPPVSLPPPVPPGADALEAGAGQFLSSFDTTHAGFGGAPKFPRPAELLFLLRESVRSGDANAGRIAVATLEAMAAGGIRDHVGGGFHRYSVDAAWRVPHFEKMLYDQAQLVLAYLEAGQAVDAPSLFTVAADTIDYVLRDLTHPEGGFYSAEDADSVPPEAAAASPRPRKAEGAFYLWTLSEIDELLGDDADLVARRFGIEPNGNAPEDPLGEFRGKNIPYLQQDVAQIARLTGRPPEDVESSLVAARQRLFDVRSERPRPHLDDKVLAAWNGMMIAALARTAHVLGGEAAERSLQAAIRAAGFVRERLWDAGRGVLARRWHASQATGGQASSIDGYAEDYACVIWGLLELVQTTGDAAWLDWALELQARQDALFRDEANGGWFATTGDDPSVLLRVKEEYDGAEPAAGSVAVGNLQTIAHLTGDRAAAARAAEVLAGFGGRFGQSARSSPMMMAALTRHHAPRDGVTQVVIVGEPGDAATRELERVVAACYLPFAVRVVVAPGEAQARLAERAPFIGAMRQIDGRPTAHVCADFACREPVTEPARLEAQLKENGKVAAR